jgi:AcrR family transcriptional regulator
MRPESRQAGQERSFIELARRAQIVEAAIETIAEVGYANASMERIAKRAGISRGLISYHFAGKDELIAQVLVTVYTDGAMFMIPRIDAESTPSGQLRAYIESNLEYMRAHPSRMAATVALVVGGVLAEGLPGIDPDSTEGLEHLEELLRQGQAAGEFRDFDPAFMARAIRNVIDGIPPRLSEPGFDMDTCIRELTTLFDVATRSGAPPAPPGEGRSGVGADGAGGAVPS